MKAKAYDRKDNGELNLESPVVTMIYKPANTMKENI